MTKPKSAKRDLTGAKVAFVEWLIAVNKTPKTQTELAVVLGVDGATLSDWKRDDYVVDLLNKAEKRREAAWARAFAELEWACIQREDIGAKVSAITQMGKLLSKYPSEKLDLKLGRMGLMEWLGSQPEESKASVLDLN